MTTPDLFQPVMAALLTCAHDALIENDRPVGRVQLAPGIETAWDNCCEDSGQLSVRLVQVYPTAGVNTSFPGQDTRPSCAPTLLAARLEVEVIRCAHTLDDGGVAPSAARVTEDANNTTWDASILFQALMCCLSDGVQGVHTWVIDRWDPKGVSGGCAGGAWQLLVAVGHCGCS